MSGGSPCRAAASEGSARLIGPQLETAGGGRAGVPLRELRSDARASAAADDAGDAEIRSIASRIPGALESFEAERAVEDRNAALRRAYSVVPGGPEALGAIERLVTGVTGVTGARKPSPRARGPLDDPRMTELPRPLEVVQREVDRALSAKTPARLICFRS